MNYQPKLMQVTLLNPFTTKWLWLNSLGLHSSLDCGPRSNLIIFFTTLGKRVLYPPCSEVNTHSVVTQQEKSGASHVSFARLLAQLTQSKLSQSQDQMDRVELLSMILTWQSASFVVFVKRHAQLTRSSKGLTSNMLLSCTRNFFTIKRSWLKMGTNGNLNLQELWR